MNKPKRSKTEPVSPESSPLTWSLLSVNQKPQLEEAVTVGMVLPPIERPHLNEEEKESVNLKVLKIMRNVYNPIGCSKSIQL